MTLTDKLRGEYIELFEDCETRPEYQAQVDRFVAKLLSGTVRYTRIEVITKVPWFVIGLVHGMECSFSFEQHLHNGDSLKRRTWQVPAGRPKKGEPPFTWEESAVDALEYDKFTGWSDWSVAGICFKLEGYNGWGTRTYHHINTPYLWSFSNLYAKGKYVQDGKWSATTVSQQVGAIVALKQMVVSHKVNLAAREV